MADAQARIRITAQDDTASAFKKATANLDALKASAAGLAGSLGGALAVGGLTALVTGAIDAADNLRDLSQSTGIAVESLGGLGFAAGQNGGSLESVASAAGKLNKTLAEAAAGSKEALEPFKALGISVKDAAGQTKAADVVFAEVADRFKTFNDGPEKSALALRLFGKAGAEQIALLNEGGDALRANIDYYKRFSGVTTEVAEAADQFNDTLGKINLISRSLGTSIASALLPSLQAVADRLLVAKENGTLFAGVATVIKVAFDSIALTAASVSYALNIAGIKLGEFAAKVALVLRRGSISEFTAISDAAKADIARATVEFKNFGNQILGNQILGVGVSSANDESEAEKRRLRRGLTTVTKTNAPRLPGSDKDKKEQISDEQRALARYVDSLQNAIDATRELTALQKAEQFLLELGKLGEVPQVRELVLGRAKLIDLAKEDAELAKLRAKNEGDVSAAILEGQAARAKALAALLEGTPTARFAQTQRDLELLQQSLADFQTSAGVYGISVEQYVEAVQKLAGISTELDKSKSLAEELGLSFTSAFEDAIVGGKSFSDVLKGLEQDILRIVTRKLVTEPLGNAITGAIGNGGGIGGFFSSIFSGLFKADGGPVRAGQSYIVGERGPELFKAPGNGTIVPTSQLAGVGGRSLTIHINPPSGMSRQSSTQFAADVARQINLANSRNN